MQQPPPKLRHSPFPPPTRLQPNTPLQHANASLKQSKEKKKKKRPDFDSTREHLCPETRRMQQRERKRGR
ncbi:hypothetical protein COCCADRAFT_82813 [Bipolaris zeicola 26-R-13]|uniref:Uncharacterized protein n=1 Tax=Cochliobolus carbonum (strain 26-R-13) TaxID=930089 RepID=W6YLW5_COCC2|nr:uncharacterized protein COCCADRAFT_82813 [Bipolaris zeicola 26-R-13]EUC38528.1 hypothetical protein COCCADRAFT_82813 [Bipolaris zeicola 26-R-13]